MSGRTLGPLARGVGVSNRDLAELGIVDTHVHFWQFELLRRAWQPPPVIFRTFGPPDLIDDAAAVGVKICVLVEAGTTAEDNQALAEFAASSDFVGAMIAYADLESPSLEQELDALAEIPKFRGVRLRCEGHSDTEILTRPGVIEGIRKVAERGLILEFLVVTGHLKDIPSVYEKAPGLKGIIDHIGKPDLRRGSDLAVWRDYMRAVAVDTDAVCKLSIGPRAADMEEIYASQGQGWKLEQLQPSLHFLLEQFGPERLAWGSDWPLVLLQSDYGGGLQTVRDALGPLEEEDEMRVFRGTAVQFYSL